LHVNDQPGFETIEADETSLEFVGQWQTLISTTNWEKGRIIHEWRQALRAAGAEAVEYSDDSWSRRVGQVSPQHVGRLRRVYERFGAARGSFSGLYWSHFQAALDWPDAEMWLEGAIQNAWSISQMRASRWEALGPRDEAAPGDEEIVASEMDEDFVPAEHEMAAVLDPSDSARAGSVRADQARRRGQEDDGKATSGDDDCGSSEWDSPEGGTEFDARGLEGDAAVQPFAHLGELPDDLAEAFEAYKLAILHHKLEGWRQTSRNDVLASLDALKKLVTAPSEG
jgi:hypothetical protein